MDEDGLERIPLTIRLNVDSEHKDDDPATVDLPVHLSADGALVWLELQGAPRYYVTIEMDPLMDAIAESNAAQPPGS